MGSVYEAEQESLGRHVALKVLPATALLEPQRLRRFQLEARSAARLHHTNIVPVYGVGAHEGLHYYVMQFIQGLGLDEVLIELQRLRQARAAEPAGQGTPVRSGTVTAAAVAHSLLSGDFAPPPREDEESSRGPRSDSSVHLPGQAAHSSLSESGQQYWQSVARIGVQVAEALAYAHAQGTLHRDVKPSNLLLDTAGTVWVTDFGLAKSLEGDDLTHTGDVVGTLRYMAPERFAGRSDVRGDVYSLGLTLYELLTLRPAFDEPDRNQLIQRVTSEEPLPPQRLNAEVPRDLETIVLKATAREPAHRYQSAGELADDLKRFLELKPIRARWVSAAERLWRWCRRNPTVASLLAALLVVLLGGLAGVSWKWREAEELRKDERTARDEADEARGEADERAAQISRELAALARANRLMGSGQMDMERQRWRQAEAAFSEAARLRPDLPAVPSARLELYQRLCLWDLVAADYARAFALQEASSSTMWYWYALSLYATGDEAGYRKVCRRMVEVFGQPTEREVAYSLGLAATLAPRPPLDRERGVRLAAIAAVDSSYRFHHCCLALAHYRAGRFDLALQAFQKGGKLEPNRSNSWSHAIGALIHKQLGNGDEARQALQQARAVVDGTLDSLVKGKVGELPSFWGDILADRALYAEARALIEGSPPLEDPRWRVIRARGLAAIGRKDEARAQLARALKAKPQDLTIRFAHFRFLVDEGDWKRAEEELAGAAGLKPDDSAVWLEGFRAYAEKGQRQRGDAALARASSLAPHDSSVWRTGFEVYARHGHWTAATAAHARALVQRPDDASLALAIFRYHADREDWARAEREYARVAAARPRDTQVRRLYADYLIGKDRDYPRAEQALTEATRLEPKKRRAVERPGRLLLPPGQVQGGPASHHPGEQPPPRKRPLLVQPGDLSRRAEPVEGSGQGLFRGHRPGPGQRRLSPEPRHLLPGRRVLDPVSAKLRDDAGDGRGIRPGRCDWGDCPGLCPGAGGHLGPQPAHPVAPALEAGQRPRRLLPQPPWPGPLPGRAIRAGAAGARPCRLAARQPGLRGRLLPGPGPPPPGRRPGRPARAEQRHAPAPAAVRRSGRTGSRSGAQARRHGSHPGPAPAAPGRGRAQRPPAPRGGGPRPQQGVA
jgi:serine/threonine protein kinase/Flp pilus assembly protein TadD